jgi:DNA-binding NarL/FixJ family response regulator
MRQAAVLLVDDNAAFLQVAAQFLRLLPELKIVGLATGGRAALTQAAQLRPDLVLIDLHMADLPGLAAIPQLRALLPHARIIALTMMEPATHRQPALDAGADEFVTKAQMDTHLLPAIERLLS